MLRDNLRDVGLLALPLERDFYHQCETELLTYS
jgi:hypothetical protein